MIFYLSCTGNTRWAAETLADITNDRLVFIPEALSGDCVYKLRDGERIGFCLPVHGWRVQPMVRQFVERLQLILPSIADGQNAADRLQRAYTYVLLTAGDSCGEYYDQLHEMLHAKGLHVHTKCSLLMPETYVGLPFMYTDTDLREAEKKMDANSLLRKFADIVVDHRAVSLPIHRGAMPRFYSRVLGTLFQKYWVSDRLYKVDTDKCVGCGQCVRHCPVQNMRMKPADNKPADTNPSAIKPSETNLADRVPAKSAHATPEWLHTGQCLNCMACYHYCPHHAIDFGPFTRKKGQYFYTHNKERARK